MPQPGTAVARGSRSSYDERGVARSDRAGRELRPRAEGSRAQVSDGPLPASSEPGRARSGDGYLAPGGVPGRRTVAIRGRGAERYVPRRSVSSRRRPERRYERSGFRPDRAAMWAVLLGVLLILVAAMSAHAAVLPHLH